MGKSPWRRKWQPSPAFLPGESLGQRCLADYSPQGLKELDTTEWPGSSTAYGICFLTIEPGPLQWIPACRPPGNSVLCLLLIICAVLWDYKFHGARSLFCSLKRPQHCVQCLARCQCLPMCLINEFIHRASIKHWTQLGVSLGCFVHGSALTEVPITDPEVS